jgi:hypothetical protein
MDVRRAKDKRLLRQNNTVITEILRNSRKATPRPSTESRETEHLRVARASQPFLRTSAMVVSSPYHCLTLSLLVFPLLLMAAYLMAAFPGPPEPVYVNPSLASLPRTEKSWSLYPEDLYPGGGYAEFPNGKVCSTGLLSAILTPNVFCRSDIGCLVRKRVQR